MSQDVHDAMLSRGFTGEFSSLALPKPGSFDYICCALTILLCCALLSVDHRIATW